MNSRATNLLFGSIMLVLMVFVYSSCMDEVGLGRDELEDPPPTLTGHAWLENQENHGGIKIEMDDTGLSLLTDQAGNFSLPADLSDGEWTLLARYPYFADKDQTIEVVDGYPDSKVGDMYLAQEIVFEVFTDKDEYMATDLVEITLKASNISDHDVTLKSDSSPATAYAVRTEIQTVYGKLLPGEGTEPDEITLEPGESHIFHMTWDISDGMMVTPAFGDMWVYAVFCTNTTHPEYFDEKSPQELNESLFSKLVPAHIFLSYQGMPSN